MSTFTHTIVHTTALQRFVHAVVGSLRTTAAAWQRARRQRAAMRASMRAMEALDDRTLADIGFARAEIGSVAAELIGAARATRRHAMQA
jgi:uncharacterized protein YjiS (DUF1127 family)